MSDTQIITQVRINQMVDVTFDVTEIIQAINANEPIENRMNIIAMLMNGIFTSKEDLDKLEPGHRKLIREYLQKKLNDLQSDH